MLKQVEEGSDIYCDVYEVDETPDWAYEMNRNDFENGLISPLKLMKKVNEKSCQNWFGNVVAGEFVVK